MSIHYVSKCTQFPVVQGNSKSIKIGTVKHSVREESSPANTLLGHDFRRVLLDFIPTIGRPHVIPVMRYLIQEDWQIVRGEFATMINYMALSIKPTPSVVEGLLVSFLVR